MPVEFLCVASPRDRRQPTLRQPDHNTMNVEEHEQLRANIWDHLYNVGPQSVERIANQMQLSQQQVVGLVDHAWFSIQNELVEIATDGGQ